MKIEKMHFTQSEIKSALENLLPKQKARWARKFTAQKTVELTAQIIVTSLQHNCKQTYISNCLENQRNLPLQRRR